MSISIKEYSIRNKDPFPSFFKFRPESCDVLIDHIVIVAGIIEEKTKGVTPSVEENCEISLFYGSFPYMRILQHPILLPAKYG